MQHKSEHNVEASAASSATDAGNTDCVGLSNSQGVGERIMGLSGDRSQRLLNEKHDDDDDGGGDNPDNNTVDAGERRKGGDREVGTAKERTSAAPFASPTANENEQFEAGRKEKQERQEQVVKTKPNLSVDTSAANKDTSAAAGMPRFTLRV